MDGQPIKKRHHYVPRSFLANFTAGRTVDSALCVFDTVTGKQREAKPGSVAFQRDLYSVNYPGIRSDGIEDIFGEVEGVTTPIIRRVCSSREMPTGDEYYWLMNYIALLAERTPARREVHQKLMQGILKMMLKNGFSTRERFEATKTAMINSGYNMDDISFEQMQRFIDDDRYTINLDNNSNVDNLLEVFDSILPVIAIRKWSVVFSPPSIGDFICSDNPVSLNWTEINERELCESPGYGLSDTEITLPLSSRVALIGRFDDHYPASGVVPSRKVLSIINSNTVRGVKRFIFTEKEDFFWFTKEEKIGNAADMKRFIQNEKTE